MNVFTSRLPKPCLSRQDEEFMKRNEKWADNLSFVAMYIVLLICLFVVGFYISYLKDESKNLNFSLYNVMSKNYGWLIVLPIAFFIYNLVGIIIKHKVNTLKKIQSKCPRI